MLKTILFGSAIAFAAPAMAQDGSASGQTAPARGTATTSSADVAGQTTAPAASGSSDSSMQTGAPSAQPQAAGGDQVTAVVESEFASYDKDANGTLSKAEFAVWMDALKAKAPNAGSQPADAQWNDAAFAQADTDKSASLTKQELTGFLGGSGRAGTM